MIVGMSIVTSGTSGPAPGAAPPGPSNLNFALQTGEFGAIILTGSASPIDDNKNIGVYVSLNGRLLSLVPGSSPPLPTLFGVLSGPPTRVFFPTAVFPIDGTMLAADGNNQVTVAAAAGTTISDDDAIRWYIIGSCDAVGLQKTALGAQVTGLAGQITGLANQVAALNGQVVALNGQLAGLQAQIVDLQATVAAIAAGD
jgi:hypothetical protein